MTDALKALFALLETEEESFAKLIERFGIDPAFDLQNCDLTDVDFGALTAKTLNLTGSLLSGANLANVRCERIIGFDGREQTSPQVKLMNDLLVSVVQYQNADWSIDRVIQETTDPHASTVLAFYGTTAEQDLLTRRLCTHFGDGSHVREGFNVHAMGMKMLWFYARALKADVKLNPAGLDKAFFGALSASNVSDDIGIYPFRPNHSAIERIRKSIHPATYEEMRAAFVRAVRRELEMHVRSGGFHTSSLLIFSGFPPMSKRLYNELREAISGRLLVIFLCSSSFEPEYLRGDGAHWRRVAVPRYSIGKALTVEVDVTRILKRVSVVAGGRLQVSDATITSMYEFVGKPLSALKETVTNEIVKAFNSGVPGDGRGPLYI